MILVAALASGMVPVYWILHTAPFRDLQQALGEQFPRSLPRVDGGRNKNSPMTLRIRLHVRFSPLADPQQADEVAQQIAQLARSHQPNFTQFEALEINLIKQWPEKELEKKKLVYSIGRDGALVPLEETSD